MPRDYNYGEGFEVANKLEAFCGTTNATNGPAVAKTSRTCQVEGKMYRDFDEVIARHMER